MQTPELPTETVFAGDCFGVVQLGHISAGMDIDCFSKDPTLNTMFLVFNCGFPAHLTQSLRQLCLSQGKSFHWEDVSVSS